MTSPGFRVVLDMRLAADGAVQIAEKAMRARAIAGPAKLNLGFQRDRGPRRNRLDIARCSYHPHPAPRAGD